MGTIDYMIAAYGPYAASATGGNPLARDVLAGFAAIYAKPFYTCFAPPNTLTIPSSILFGVAVLLVIPIFVFYFCGETVRGMSPIAKQLASEGKAGGRAVKRELAVKAKENAHVQAA